MSYIKLIRDLAKVENLQRIVLALIVTGQVRTLTARGGPGWDCGFESTGFGSVRRGPAGSLLRLVWRGTEAYAQTETKRNGGGRGGEGDGALV